MSESGSSRAVRISRVVYWAMVASYPAEIRREHGVEMVQAFGNRCSDAFARRGLGGLVRVWFSTLKDFFTTVPAEWRDSFADLRRSPKRTGKGAPKPRSEQMMASLLSDLRFATRQLIRKPGFTVVAVVTLSLGVGANTAIFSVVNGVLLRPLAFDEPDEIVMVWESNPGRGFPRFPASPANFVDWVDRNDVFDGIAATSGSNQTLTGSGEPVRLIGTFTSASLFSLLGVPPILGRTFSPDENQVGNDAVAILSNGLWRTRFGSDPAVIGRAITLDGVTVEVIGVLPPGFAYRSQTDVWRPLTFDFDVSQSRGGHFLRVIARLRNGVSITTASASMKTFATALEQQYPTTNAGWTVEVVSLHDQVVGNVRTALVVLLGAVGVVLLIASANVANLLLARASGRRQEIAVRSALGARRNRLIRQMLTESTVLSVVGGGAGLLLAVGGLRLLLALNPGNLPRLDSIGIDGLVLLFTFGITVATGLVFGLAPALQSTRGDVNEALKAGGVRMGGTSGRGIRDILLVSQVALALMLMIGSGLLLRSFFQLQSIEPGFEADNVVTMRVSPPTSRYSQNANVATFYSDVIAHLQAVPGIRSVGVTTNLPLFGSLSFTFNVVGRPEPDAADMPSGNYRTVSTDYLRTMGIPMLRGRGFTAQDHASGPSVVIVNESLVSRYFPDEDPIGQSLDIHSGNASCPCEIVGVVADVKQGGLEDETAVGYYLPTAQSIWRTRSIVVRTALPTAAAIARMRAAVAAVDPDLAVYSVQTLEERLGDAVAQPRFNMVMLGIFAAVAVVLAMVGIYGVMSYNVSQRTKEFGVRVAMGANATRITWLVVGQALLLAGVGVTLGVGGAYGTTRFLSSMLFGVDPLDTATFGGVIVLIFGVAGLASYLPARRAARIDPVTALRGE